MESSNFIRKSNIRSAKFISQKHNKSIFLKKEEKLPKIIILIFGIIIIYLIFILIIKSHIFNRLNIKNKELNQEIPEIILKYQNELKLEQNKIQELIDNNNYDNVKENI